LDPGLGGLFRLRLRASCSNISMLNRRRSASFFNCAPLQNRELLTPTTATPALVGDPVTRRPSAERKMLYPSIFPPLKRRANSRVPPPVNDRKTSARSGIRRRDFCLCALTRDLFVRLRHLRRIKPRLRFTCSVLPVLKRRSEANSPQAWLPGINAGASTRSGYKATFFGS
jgi:hypothetical protein